MAEPPQTRSRSGDRGSESGFALRIAPPSLPKGGGAIRGMGEKFAANPVSGTGAASVPIYASPGRGGFGPQLVLGYDSGAGNGPFGLGWHVALPAITRKTDKGLPRYQDTIESDVFILAGAEDLVPVLTPGGGAWQRAIPPPRTLYGAQYKVDRYRPRIEGLFARIERWSNVADPSDTFWRSISKTNVTAWYGLRAAERIADPANPARIFSWLISESHDDKGNVASYGYKAEDSAGIDLTQAHEANRTTAGRAANRYLKRIRYGNSTPYYPDLTASQPVPLPTDWHFELVFDFGEHDPDAPLPDAEARPWPVRPDPFSSYRAAFEIRTYRRCRRVLMFHHFPAETGIGANCLVRSTDLSYSDPTDPVDPAYSFLTAVTQTGYRRGGESYLAKSMPPVEFTYSQPTMDPTLRDIDPASLENLPVGLDGDLYRWVDLDGEGSSGILTGQGGRWFYKPNWSAANRVGAPGQERAEPRLGPMGAMRLQPALASSDAVSGARLMDLAGSGHLDLVDPAAAEPGFHERSDEGWSPFKAFRLHPELDWDDPDLRLIDLTGDGLPDILIGEQDAFYWSPAMARAGFGGLERAIHRLDEEKGPAVIFADGAESIFLADMSGDGLTDIVRVRNGEVCYWPNLGYGRFGAKIAMDAAPRFDRPDLFDGRRIRLVDIDGSGTADLVYFGSQGTSLYFNLSGNSWGQRYDLAAFPPVETGTAANALDLLGTGTACLVWSSSLASDARRMRYVDLLGGQKPHLLVGMTNNLGAETQITYAPSTRFYVADKLAGRPWVTRIPFPVHVVERVVTQDWISRNRFVTRYAYHHGHYDGVEREFRGFALVEHWDGEDIATLYAEAAVPPASNADPAANVPPIHTKTWYHTGAYFDAARISTFLAGDYYREEGLDEAQLAAMRLPDTILPAALLLADGSRVSYTPTADELREACRSLKGLVLRQEIYGLDGSAAAGRPYSVVESNYTIEMLQPRGANRHAVFFAHERETLGLHYERALYEVNGRRLADPRVSHAVTLTVDPVGNPLTSVVIDYGRRHADSSLGAADQAVQALTRLILTENQYTAALDQDDLNRAPLPAESRGYELLKCSPSANRPDVTNLFGFDELTGLVAAAGDGAHDLPFEDVDGKGATETHPYRRLLKRMRTLYRRNDLTGPLPLGQADSLGLIQESYRQVLTPGLLTAIYGGRIDALSLAGLLQGEAGYTDLDGTGEHWSRSGRSLYSSDPATPDPAFARAHFYTVRGIQDPFGGVTQAEYDSYDLSLVSVQDAVGNVVTAQPDYRTLQPVLITDPNGNRAAIAFDALGMVAGTARMGKASESLGDSLAGFDPDPGQTAIDAFYGADDPHSQAAPLLGNATTRVIYDIDRFRTSRTANPADPTQWEPAFAATIARETHVSDLTEGASSALQIAFGYSDGFGREIQRKVQAEPETTGGPLRWVASGWTIFNNKGSPVRSYEPFFSGLAQRPHRFEFGVALGVSPILLYDPASRVAAILHPNQSWEKVAFDPWRQESWDVNDTLLIADPRTDADVGGFFSLLPDADYLPGWYAQRQGGTLGPAEQDAAAKAAIHAATPLVTHRDSHGRVFLTIAHNRFKHSDAAAADPPAEEFETTRVVLDIEGNQRQVIDALGRVAFRFDYDMLGRELHQASMDAGERWTLNNALGLPIRAWTSRGFAFRTEYDALFRPTRAFVTGADASQPQRELLVERGTYGDDPGNGLTRQQAIDANLLAHAYQHYDAAGLATNAAYDFKGNVLAISRRFLVDYKASADWSANPVPALEAEVFTATQSYDALDRPVAVTTPDGSVYRPGFNESSLLRRIDVSLRGAATATPFVTDIAYNAKGQRLGIAYGNGTRTDYAYDPLTFRLVRLKTTRASDQATLQDLAYTTDPAGNITRIVDSAQQTVYFSNQAAPPGGDYTHDSLYRLISSAGREQIGQAAQPQTTWNDEFRTGLAQPGDGQAMRAYREQYDYDAVGNLLALRHQASGGAWSRTYAYAEASQIETGKSGNRLSRTILGDGASGTEPYTYDAHGNMTAMPHLSLIAWDYRDRLQATARQAVSSGPPETTYYVYDSAGQRARKVTETRNGVLKEERLYLGGFEIYRDYDAAGANIDLERQTLHVMDKAKRVALVETLTRGSGPVAPAIRYQLGNHLDSAMVEADESGQVISYEEYYPFGGTSYQAGRAAAEASLKRYRFTARERDEENGFYYHGARYYAPWIGRWTSCDPAGLKGGLNPFVYAADAPTRLVDLTGLSPSVPDIPAGGQAVKTLQEGLDLLNRLTTAQGESGSTEWFLGQKGGSYRVFKIEGDLGGAIPKGYTAVAHTHPPGAMVTAEDVATTAARGVKVGGTRTHLVARGGNRWAAIEVPKSGAAKLTELDLQAGKVTSVVELERVGVGSHGLPHKFETGVQLNQPSSIKNTSELAEALEGSKPLGEAVASTAGKAGSAAGKAAEVGGAATKTAEAGSTAAKLADAAADAGKTVGKGTEIASGGRFMRYVGTGGKVVKVAGEVYIAGAVVHRFFLVGYHIREWQGREALNDLGDLLNDLNPASIVIDLIPPGAANHPFLRGLNFGWMPLDELNGVDPDDEWKRKMNAIPGMPHQLTSDEY